MMTQKNATHLISFLGTGKYIKCSYHSREYTSPVVTYIQSAVSDLVKPDRITIFVTCRAKETHAKSLNDELIAVFKNNNRPLPILNFVDIPDGGSEAELWDIFSTVFDQIQNHETIYYDITHSFRSLPMLGMVLLQYAKFLKHIEIGKIYYGAFETLGDPRTIEERIPNPEDRRAPIFDLTSFDTLHEWTVGADAIISYGDSDRIDALVTDHVKPILKEKKGKDPDAQNLRGIASSLKKITDDHRTTRALDIASGYDISKIRSYMNNIEVKDLPALPPILHKVINAFEAHADKKDYRSIFAASKWCIDRKMYQEGLTLLEEGITTFFINKFGGDVLNKDLRNGVGHTITKYPISNSSADEFIPTINNIDDSSKSIIKKIIDHSYDMKALTSAYNSIKTLRNDINHAGHITNGKIEKDGSLTKTSAESAGLIRNIPSLYSEVCSLLKPLTSTFLNLSNHPSDNWSAEQAEAALNYGSIVDWPFPAVKPKANADEIMAQAASILADIQQEYAPNELTIHIMGEQRLTTTLVHLLQRNSYTCLASTSVRSAVETEQGKISQFTFVAFQEYPKFH